MSRCALLAAFFKEHPDEWIDGTRLEFAGRYAWRTRLSELRFPPWNMVIENRVRRRQGSVVKISEYRFLSHPTPQQVLFS